MPRTVRKQPTRVPAPAARTVRARLEDLLGTRTGSDQDVVNLVEQGLPSSVLDRLLDRGLTRPELFDAIIPARTLKHRKAKRQALSREESERVVRVARMMATASSVLGGDESALAWLRSPKRRFHERTPFQMLATEFGGRMVEEMLIQIDEGMYG